MACFASGRGSNFRNIFQHTQEGKLPARIVLFVTNNGDAPALRFARENDIPSQVLALKQFDHAWQYSHRMMEVLQAAQVEWIVLAGYLKKIPESVVDAYRYRIVNIHPALLPFFGGKGMYGMRVHQAVYHSGMQVSGVTVHFVTEEYDEGPIIYQEPVTIRECRSPEEVARKVLQVEHRVYPHALQLLFEKTFTIEGKRVIFH